MFTIIINSIFQKNHVEIFEIIKQCQYLLFFILAYNINWSENKKSIIKGIINFSIIILSFGSLEILYVLIYNIGDLTDNLYLISSTFSHKNIYSIVVMLSLPYLAISNLNKKKKLTLLCWSSIILITLQTRSVLLALICAFSYLLIIKNKSLKHKLSRGFIISIPIVFISFFIQYHLGTFDSFIEIFDFSNTNSNRFATISERLYLWGHSLQMFIDNWLFGVGIGNWPINFPMYGLKLWRLRQGEVIMQRPHNDFIENFNELGIIGGVIFTIMLVYPLIKKLNSEYKSILNFGLICFIVVSIFSFPQERIIPSLLFFTLVSYKLQNNNSFKINKFSLIILFCLTTPFIYINYIKLKSEVNFKKYLSVRQTINNIDAINLLSKSKTTFSQLDKTSTPIDYYIGELYLKKKDVETAIKYFKNALVLNPNNIHILNGLGRCYIFQNNLNLSFYYFKNAIQIAPFFEDGLYNLAYTYSKQSEYNKALKVLKNIDNKTSDKFNDVQLYYAKKIIRSQIIDINTDSLDKENMINLISNNDWILSIINKSFKNNISFKDQLILDINYIKKIN